MFPMFTTDKVTNALGEFQPGTGGYDNVLKMKTQAFMLDVPQIGEEVSTFFHSNDTTSNLNTFSNVLIVIFSLE